MAASNTVSDPRQPVVALHGFSYAYPDETDWVLRDICLTIEAGQCHLLQGPTGAGKTTLLMAIRNLLPPGRRAGTIEMAPSVAGNGSCAVGLVRQNPQTQLLGANLGADVAFGLENHGVDPMAMPERVRTALNVVGLRQPLSLPVEALSMGQQYRACMAGLMVMDPVLIMLDEPMAQLDPGGKARTMAMIRNLKNAGRAVLICDHRPGPLHAVVDRFWRLDETGRITATPSPFVAADPPAADSGRGGTALQPYIAKPPPPGKRQGDTAAKEIAHVRALRFDDRRGGLDLTALSFCVVRGERVAIRGPNGSGKTTLIRCLAGLIRPCSGSVEVLGATPRLAALRGRVTVLFQEPRRQMFEATVFEEVAFAARRSGLPADRVAGRVHRLLDQLQLGHLGDTSPHRLSYGQTHLVGLAAVLAGDPEILLLDDPFAGLDPDRARRVMQLVSKLTSTRRTTVIWTTHDADDIKGWADRVIPIPQPQKDRSREASRIDHGAPVGRRIRLPAPMMLGLCLGLSMLAFAARSPALLYALSSINLLLIALLHPRPLRFLRKSTRLFFWQAGLVALLYAIRFGISDGLAPGLRVAWQLFLAFWPGMIFMATHSQPRIARILSRLLPPGTAFVAATCLRFLPLLLAEMQQIREVQVLRGARILAADLKTPKFWPDWIRCLLVPTLIKTLSLAEEIATAAKARDFGIHRRRTNWPGD